ncbi:MAG: hypothetical protein IJP02_04320 [Oscillospiraceae bacterium]|nr:hypothetical protein [Oscillospiraceae bacterium]
MKQEHSYEFRTRCCRSHHRIYGWKNRPAGPEELALGNEVTICCRVEGPVAANAVKDLRAYLRTAFGIATRMVEDGADITVYLDTKLKDYMARTVTVSDKGVDIAAADDRGAAQGIYGLEDAMDLRMAPVLKKGTVSQKPAFSPRMTHSGLGMDLFPDEYLAVCARHGFDAILVFIRDEHTAGRKGQDYDFADVIRRAARYGLDVYAYSYISNYVHPDEPNARETFDRAYGDIFRTYPGIKGMVFVGESVQFPSKDPRANPIPHPLPTPDGLPDPRPRSGWWPCSDYDRWITMARDSIRDAKPDADVVLWSYNWGKQPKDVRVALLESLPTDISLLVTFEMFDRLELGSSHCTVSDYTISHVGPCEYFVSEAEVAKRRGIRLYAMTNTAGRTWDFGVAPYEPFPWQWHARHEKILECRDKYGLCGLMESHHFGFYPSFISMQAKQAFTQGGMAFDEYLSAWAKNVAGDYARQLLQAMERVDESIRYTVPSAENQYGPYRIGPAYPFCMKSGLKKPNTPDMHFGNAIYSVVDINRDYSKGVPYSLRVRDELRLAGQALTCCREGLKLMRSIPDKGAELKRLIDLVEFLARCHETACNHKQFYILRTRLLASGDRHEIVSLAKRIEQVCCREIKNVEATIPLVQRRSELGYEPSMEYQCDEAGLRWKLKHMDYVIRIELACYRNVL